MADRVGADARDCLARMIAREPTRLPRRIVRLVHDAGLAEDLAQESLVRALRSIATVRGGNEGTVCAWLDRIARNVAFNHARDARRPGDASLDAGDGALAATIGDPAPEPPAAVAEAEARCALLDAIRALPPDLRDVFLMRDAEGRSTAEKAAALGIGEGLVKWRLHHARKRLRAQLDVLRPR